MNPPLLIIGPEIDLAAVIVYGPPGCGKTRHADEIAKLLGKARVLDDWKLGDHLPSDTLCLSSDARVHGLEQIHLPYHERPSVIIEFDLVAAILGIDGGAECAA